MLCGVRLLEIPWTVARQGSTVLGISHSLLQGIFQKQGVKSGSPALQEDHLSHKRGFLIHREHFFTMFSHFRGDERVLWDFFYKTLILLMRAPPSGLKELAKACLCTAITVDIRISTCKFCGATNIQTIAFTQNKTKQKLQTSQVRF